MALIFLRIGRRTALLRLAALSALAAAWGGHAHAAAPANAQAVYDAAQAAYDKDDWAAAAAGFKTLLPSDADKRLQPFQAIIAARYADCLVHTGRARDARPWLDRAIAALPQDNARELGLTHLSAGTAARFDFDAPAAIAAYEHAITLAQPAGMPSLKLNATLGLAITAATIDPKRAAALLDDLLADTAALATVEKKDVAVIEEMRARAAINAGDKSEAERWIRRALDHSGGSTTTKISLNQVEIRGDAAIISQLRGDDEATRKYLTFTGAGHLKSTAWIGRYNGTLPVCGQDGDIRPEDSAVVQFAIADDGHVVGAQPIYASRPGDIGWAFARAMNSWRWNPDLLTDVDSFWRASVRFELRCIMRPAPEALSRPYWRDVADWLASKGVPAERDPDAFVPANDPRLTREDVTAIPALLGRLDVKSERDPQLVARTYRALDAAHAPASAYALTALYSASSSQGVGSLKEAGRARADALAAIVPELRRRFHDQAAIAWLTLEQAMALEDAGAFDAASPLLQSVLATPVSIVPEDDPVRQVAVLHAALVKSKTGDPGAIAATSAAAGLDSRQCSLIDTHPLPENVAISSSQFPAEALMWRFEGYVQEAFDIQADGSVANIRTVLAYPPFIFGPGTERAVAKFRYSPPSIGNQPVGCTGKTERVSYRIPTG